MNAKHNVVRLRQRRDQILTTLAYLAAQREEVEENTEWKDAVSQRRRQILLNDLNGWYLVAIAQVERAMARIPKKEYGVCLLCSKPIEPECLETSPEAEFCTTCQGRPENWASQNTQYFP